MSGLGPITAVTIATAELQRSIDAWHLYLGYDLVAHERLSAETAALWGRPGLAGRHVALMLPEGAGSTFVRFVENRPAPDYRPFRHFGWNAAELMVQDTDAAAARLADSPFRIIGPPAALSFSDKIRAMQAVGPAGEAVYLTSFAEKLAAFDVPDAQHFIDRVFIVILGGQSCESINAFYLQHFGVPESPPLQVVISVLSEAHGLPASTRHALAALPLAGQCYIEADAMPPTTSLRPTEAGELPPAIAMVSFVVPILPAQGLTWLAPPRRLPEAPYHGRRAVVCVGPAGELIELIEGA